MKKSIFNRQMLKTWIVTLVILIVAIVGILIMPDIIPTHFGPSGEPDAWGTKYSVLMYPIAVVVVTILAVPLMKLDPKLENYERFEKYYYNFFFGFALFFLVIEIANIAIALGMTVNVGSVISFTMGIFMAFIGNMMPKIKQNFSFGIKVPWTLADEEVWFKTHRLGGKMFVLGGVLMMVGAFIPGSQKVWLLLAAILVMVLVTFAYSVIIYLKKHKSQEN